jgi:hypothetical protein
VNRGGSVFFFENAEENGKGTSNRTAHGTPGYGIDDAEDVLPRIQIKETLKKAFFRIGILSDMSHHDILLWTLWA